MSLSVVLAATSLLLGVPLGLLFLLTTLQAIGPGRRRVKPVRLPDLTDEELSPRSE